MIGERVVTEAESWIGTPFHWQGRVKGVGCDCKGLVAGVAAALGRPEAASLEALAGDYGEQIDQGRLRAGLARLFDRVSNIERGDVLLLRVKGRAQHLGIAAPINGTGVIRTIEAMVQGPSKVLPYRRRSDEIDSVWRWRDLAVREPGALDG